MARSDQEPLTAQQARRRQRTINYGPQRPRASDQTRQAPEASDQVPGKPIVDEDLAVSKTGKPDDHISHWSSSSLSKALVKLTEIQRHKPPGKNLRRGGGFAPVLTTTINFATARQPRADSQPSASPMKVGSQNQNNTMTSTNEISSQARTSF
jgi:hypothetical protein